MPPVHTVRERVTAGDIEKRNSVQFLRCRVEKLPAWPVIESRFAASPRLGLAAVCQRAAARVCPVIARAETVYGVEAVEWLNAIAQVVRLLEAVCRGVRVSRFTLDIAAEVARGTANSARTAVRERGPSPAAEDAELAFAVAAFAVEVLRATHPAKAASVAVQCLRNALAGGLPEKLLAFDLAQLDSLIGVGNTDWDATDTGPFAELWPFGEPDWVTAGLARFREAEPTLPVFVRLPTL